MTAREEARGTMQLISFNLCCSSLLELLADKVGGIAIVTPELYYIGEKLS